MLVNRVHGHSSVKKEVDMDEACSATDTHREKPSTDTICDIKIAHEKQNYLGYPGKKSLRIDI